MRLSELLEKNQKKIDYRLSEEFKAINSYHIKLDMLHVYHDLVDNDGSTFSLILGYAIVNALKNKELIEGLTFKYIDESIKTNNFIDQKAVANKLHQEIVSRALPYFVSEGVEYYVPIFSRALNAVYSSEPYKLNDAPYNGLIESYDTSTIDLFEVYNFALFDSNFTRLVKIRQFENVVAFYHPDFRTLYFINDQGRLDYHLALFDKYLNKINTNHIVERLSIVADAYFNKNKALMMNELIKNELVSEKMIYKIMPNKNKKKL